MIAPVEITIPSGQRNATLFSRARSLFRQGYDDNELCALLSTLNHNRCVPPLEDSEVLNIVVSAAKYERGELRIGEVSLSSSPKSNDSDDTLPEVRRFMDMTPPQGPRPYIVDGVLFAGFAGALYGDGGSAKSLLMMHMGQSVARGEDWLGFDTVKTNVLYLDFELDEDEQSRRAYQVASGMGYAEPPEGFYYLSAAGYLTRPMFDHALNICREHCIGMVIVDSLGYALEGDAEASRDVLRFFREVEGSFRRESVSLFIVDHQSKHGNYQEKTMFGSVYKTNSIRSVFQVEPGEHDDGYINLTVRHKKINFGPKLDPFGIRVTFDADKVSVDERELDTTELVGESTLNSRDRVLIALADGPMFPADIADATGLELGTVKNALTALRKNREVENTGLKDSHGSNEVRLPLSSLSLGIGDDDSDTRQDSQDRPLAAVG